MSEQEDQPAAGAPATFTFDSAVAAKRLMELGLARRGQPGGVSGAAEAAAIVVVDAEREPASVREGRRGEFPEQRVARERLADAFLGELGTRARERHPTRVFGWRLEQALGAKLVGR